MLPLILDSRPGFLPESEVSSLLTLPLGTRTVLAHVAERLGPDLADELLIAPAFPPDADYAARLRASVSSTLRVVDADELIELLERAEPADALLVVDPARWPVEDFALDSFLARHGSYRGAIHLIAVGADHERTRERVELDRDGQVRRVQRLYDGVIWPEVATSGVVLSRVPARAVGRIRFRSLGELRASLAARGVLSRDEPVALDCVNLAEERGFIAANERQLAGIADRAPEAGFSRQDGQSLLGRNVQLHPSARLIGPIVIHDGTTVMPDVTIIGPTVIGAGCKIEQGATIAQSVLAGNTVAPAGETIRHRFAAGRNGTSAASALKDSSSGAAPPESARDFRRLEGDAPPSVSMLPPPKRLTLSAKRVGDLLVSGAGLLLLSPLFALTALLIKATSRGPILFVHRRERRDGKEFPCLKFRTMSAGAHRQQRDLYRSNELDGPQFKIREDPRITKLGKILRTTNMDELPQLFNVFLGHMSTVGPRPSPFRENQICIPWRRARLSVRPGMTGLWQVCRDSRAGSDFDQWIHYDMLYVRHLSLWLDFKILLATILTAGGKWSVPLSWMISTAASRPSSPEGSVTT